MIHRLELFDETKKNYELEKTKNVLDTDNTNSSERTSNNGSKKIRGVVSYLACCVDYKENVENDSMNNSLQEEAEDDDKMNGGKKRKIGKIGNKNFGLNLELL